MTSNNTITQAFIQEWLITTVAHLSQQHENTICISAPLAEYGLDSVHAVGLSGDIEERFGLIIEPTIAWDYPTIEKMSEFILSKILKQTPDYLKSLDSLPHPQIAS